MGSVRQRDANPREWERAALHAEERLRHLSAERHLEQQLLSLEHAVTRALAEAQGAPEGLKSLIKAVCELQGWDYGRYWQLDEGAGVLRFGASWSVPDPVIVEHLVKTRDLIFTPGKGLVGIVLQTGKPVLEPDLSRNPLVLQEMFARQSGLRGACTFPVNFEGETIGVLAFVGREVREADARLLEAMAAIGSQVGQFLKRKQAEAEIRESESRYRSLVGLAADWYWETDADYRFTRVHMQSEAQRERNQEKILGRRPWELGHQQEPDSKWADLRAALDARRLVRELEVVTRDVQDRPRHILVSGHPVFDAQGVFTGYRGISLDVTHRRRSEQLHALEHAVSRCLADNDEPARALEEVLRTICESRGIEMGRYVEVDESADVLRFVSAWGVAGNERVQKFIESSREVVFRPGEGGAGRAWQSGAPVWIADVTKDGRVLQTDQAAEVGLRSAFLLPVHSDGRIIGVLSLAGSRMREPDDKVLASAKAIGGMLGQYLGRARSRVELRENEARFRSLTELSSDWYWEQNEECRFVEFSGGIGKWGSDQNEAIGKRRWEIKGVVPVSGSWDEHKATLAARRPFRDFQYSRVRGDGVAHYVSASGHPVYDDAGRFLGYRGVATDITGRKSTEEDLLRFRAALNASGDTIVLIDRRSLRYIDANQTFCELVGYTRDEVLAMTPMDLFSADRGTLERDYDALIADSSGPARSFLGEYRRKDGTRVAVESRRRALQTKDGWIIVANARDITDRNAQEQALRDSNLRLELQARRQERIARFGQFALKRRSSDELVAEAVAELSDLADVVALFERSGDSMITLRIAHGELAAESAGQSAPLSPDSAARRVLESGSSVSVSGDYLAATPMSWPWSAWMRQMAGGAFVPVTHNGHAHGMLGFFSRAKGAIGEEEVRFAESIGNVLSTALQREKAEHRLAFLAQFDSLTGLPNRNLLEDRLKQTVAQAQRKQRSAGVLYVDLDRFKLINDTLGHQSGDLMIREVGSRLEKCVRPGDTVGRLSGDEFAVVLSDLAHAEDAGLVAQKILDDLARPFDLGGSEAFVTASIGISICPGDSEDADTLLRNADMAMYKAKKTTRNAYRYFTARMNERTLAKLQLNTDLRRAVERREFALHYQPKVDLSSRALVGMEALLRWNHPQRGLVSPGEFIPALEDSGLILQVGEWVLDEACAQQRRWQLAGLQAVPVAINLSAKQFRRKDLDQVIQRALAAAGLPAALLELEITESGIADDPEDAVRQLKNLREAGLTIAVDDFGTGYSSLAYLSTMPLSALKIDRSFITRMMDDPNTMTLVQTIISLAHSLRMVVVAEGVETEAQARTLQLLRCDQMQGYLYGRPVAPAEIEGRLSRAVPG